MFYAEAETVFYLHLQHQQIFSLNNSCCEEETQSPLVHEMFSLWRFASYQLSSYHPVGYEKIDDKREE